MMGVVEGYLDLFQWYVYGFGCCLCDDCVGVGVNVGYVGFYNYFVLVVKLDLCC